MLLKKTFLSTLTVIFLASCSVTPSNNIDAEPALALLGGAVLGTQNNAIVAMKKAPSTADKVLDFINPISEAFAAAAACPAITTGTCNGAVLSVFYNNCQASGFGQAGYWRSYVSHTFPSPADCANILTTGFNAAGAASLVGKTVTRQWGNGSQSADQQNMRAASDSVIAYVYSDFPSGWKYDRVGGVDITFETATRRRMVVNGIHAIGIYHSANVVTNPSSFDLNTVSTDATTDKSVYRKWDHTINSTKTGDKLFGIGMQISQNGDGSVSFGGVSNNTTATFDGDIVVNTNTVSAGAQLRVQHNMSQSIGVLTVTTPLVYSDPSCCYPSSGAVRVEYDLSLKVPTVEERITFTGASCGAIQYTSSVLSNASKTLTHCF